MTQVFQANRFEWKYLIGESQARGVRDFVLGHLEVDEHARDQPDHAYPVYSLYLDSPALVLYRQSLRGLKNRFKLRVRFYDDVPAQPVFLEIKRRLNGVICKERACVSRDAVPRLLRGGRPGLQQRMPSEGHRHAELALENFCGLCEDLGATAAAYVSYVREAYVSPQCDQLRVTLDRQVRGALFEERRGLAPPTANADPQIEGVVLEIKFVDRFPQWLREMVWAFDLQRCAMAKYVRCVEALKIRPGGWHGPQSGSLSEMRDVGCGEPASCLPWDLGAGERVPSGNEQARDAKRESAR